MTIQIAVKLSAPLVGELDALVERGDFESRSHAVRAGIEGVISAHRRRELDDRYRDAVATLPETEAEIADATRLAVEAIQDEPWERWW